MNEHDEPIYVISVAARMLGVHAQTLRYYERAGLIEPSRSEGNHRYYSERDLQALRRIKTLMDDLGINMAGVEVALKLMERVSQLEQEVLEMKNEIQRLRIRQEPPALREGLS